jgi:rod shape-determining protein MreB and related proteins
VNQPVTYLGLDLGTFKTSVTSSNGKRFVIPSVVGWPKDRVARALLGRDLIFGEEALQHESSLNVVRPFLRGALKYVDGMDVGIRPEAIARHKEAALLLVQHVVSHLELPAGRPIYGVIGTPSRATVLNKQVIINAARRTLDAVMVVADPFNIAYGMNQLSNSLVIDIGASTIDICPMYGTYPKDEDQITLPIGGDTIDDEFHRLIKQSEPRAELSLTQAREIKEEFGFVLDGEEAAIATLSVAGNPTQIDVSQHLNAACRSSLPGITEALLELVSKFDRDFQQTLFNNILLGGGGGQLKGLDRQMEKALQRYGAAKVTRVPDSVFAGATGALKMATNMPAEYWQQIVAPTGNKKRRQEKPARVSLRRAA